MSLVKVIATDRVFMLQPHYMETLGQTDTLWSIMVEQKKSELIYNM